MSDFPTRILSQDQELATSEQVAAGTTAAKSGNCLLWAEDWQGLYGEKKGGELGLDQCDRNYLLNRVLHTLETGDFQQRWEVAKVLPTIGEEAIAPLIELLEDEDAQPEARWFAGRILGQFHHPIVVMALVKVLTDSEDEDLTEMAVHALANIGSAAIDTLSNLLTQQESLAVGVQTLAQIRRPEVIPALLSVVKDPVVSIRTTAIAALSSFPDFRVVPVLLEALGDTAAGVRKEAVIGLGLRAGQLKELNLVKHLKPLLYDLNLEVCRQAAIALGRLGTEKAADALFQVFKSPATPIELNIEIVRALSWSKIPIALDYLQQGLYWGSQPICREIVAVLGRVESAEFRAKAAQILIEFLNCGQLRVEEARIKVAIALSLGQLGQPIALQPLSELAANSQDTVRLHAISALKKIVI